MWLIYPKATFATLRGSLRPLRRVAARALERFAFCATSLRFTSFIFGACVRRTPSEPVSVFSVVKNPASNSHFTKHPETSRYHHFPSLITNGDSPPSYFFSRLTLFTNVE